MWRINTTFSLIALCTVPYELVMQAFLSKLAQFQTFLSGVKQMHVVDSLGVVCF